jgi:hypothetical protein
VEALKAVTAADGVHFTDMGYDCMVKNIVQIPAKPTGIPQTKAPPGTSKMHYWRGFRSPVGSAVNMTISNGPLEAVAHKHGVVPTGTPGTTTLTDGISTVADNNSIIAVSA